MDISTIVGLMFGMAMIVYGISSKPLLFVDIASMGIVMGGAIGSLMISLPLVNVLSFHKPLMKCFFSKSEDQQVIIKKLVEFAEIARRDGILALENVTGDITDKFLVKGIQLAVDGTDPELIEQIMNNELETLEDRHATGKKVFDTLGKYAPAWGMIGTLIGLILMLADLDDPSKLGAGMSVALITTFYGAVIANFIFLPISDKLQKRHDEEMLQREIILRGVMSIQSGDNPRIVKQRLEIFLPPSEREGDS